MAISLSTPRRMLRLWLSPEAWRRRLIFWSGGLIVGLAAVGLAMASDAVQRWFALASGRWPYIGLAATPAGLALSAFLMRRYFPGSQGSGIPQAIAARALDDAAARHRLLSLRIAVGKVLLTLLALMTGASVGREGPTVQIGASIMHAVGTLSGGRHRGLVLAGSAAGVAAAFNTPLAGIVFAIEEMSRSFEQRTSGLVLTAVIVAGIASLGLLGNYTYFGQTSSVLHGVRDWAAIPLCGILGGIAGGVFSHIVVTVSRGLPGRIGALVAGHPIILAALCGLGVGAIGVVAGGTTYGTGYDEARRLVEGGSATGSFGLLKLAATTLSTISGVPGGIFSPSLAVGAGFGADIAALLSANSPGAVVLLGMVAYFSGVVQAPITAFIIVMEMTDNHNMAVPLMMTSLIAYGSTRFIGARPIYQALAEKFIASGGVRRTGAADEG
jgi:H+/Cl- antiporter ClcA